jgi:hypothetical protein
MSDTTDTTDSKAIILHRHWDVIQTLPDGLVLVYDTWFSGFRMLSTIAQAGTRVYISPQAARQAYNRADVYSLIRLKTDIARAQVRQATRRR